MENSNKPDTRKFGTYHKTILCWRCWIKYTMYSVAEFADILIFHCDTCGSPSATETYGDFGQAEKKFLDVHYPDTRGWGDRKHGDGFLRMLEEHWSEPCSCGGRFRISRWPSCPRCHSKPLRWLSMTNHDIVKTHPIPSLKINIPPNYTKAPARPSLNPKSKPSE